MLRRIHAFFNPEQFQGWNKKKNYFEGWYYKIIDPTEQFAYAVIPGINIDNKGNKDAFIQVLDGKKLSSEYHKFDFNSFKPKPGKLDFSIGQNHFTESSISLDLPGFKGDLNFKNTIAWPKPFYSPGIMGPYAFVPFMECYHGIVSMDHTIEGMLSINNSNISFDKGRGYMEKDWGKSFPSAYFWLQSNHFSEENISIKASVAKIPWLKGSFIGFICGIWLKNRLIQFTTYNGTRLKRSFANKEIVELVMQNRNYELKILAHRDKATSLASPIQGSMEGRIEESMNAQVMVTLRDLQKDQVILEDRGKNTALEVAGCIEEIFI